uniref:Uncharacterized protein n=1 Tax=Solanum tuberosum TaxID=4113 RepID=M1DTJ0_SOLTU
MRDCPTLKVKGKETNQIAHDGPDLNAPKRNRFYMLQANKDKGTNEVRQDEGSLGDQYWFWSISHVQGTGYGGDKPGIRARFHVS